MLPFNFIIPFYQISSVADSLVMFGGSFWKSYEPLGKQENISLFFHENHWLVVKPFLCINRWECGMWNVLLINRNVPQRSVIIPMIWASQNSELIINQQNHWFNKISQRLVPKKHILNYFPKKRSESA